MRPMTIFIIVCSFWILSEIFIGIRRRSATTGAEKQDRMSLYAMWIAFTAGPFFGGFFTVNFAEQLASPPCLVFGSETLAVAV